MTDIMINDAYIFMYTELSEVIPAYKEHLRVQLANREKIEKRLKREYFPVGVDLTNAFYYVNYSEKLLSIFPDKTEYPKEVNVDLTFAGDSFFERLQKDRFEKERSLDNVAFAYERPSLNGNYKRLMEEYEQKAGDYYLDVVIFQEQLLPVGFPHCLYEWTLDFGSRKMRLKKKDTKISEAI